MPVSKTFQDRRVVFRWERPPAEPERVYTSPLLEARRYAAILKSDPVVKTQADLAREMGVLRLAAEVQVHARAELDDLLVALLGGEGSQGRRTGLDRLDNVDYNCDYGGPMIIANVRELKARASEYIRKARKSGGVVVVSHGRPTAALIPLDADGLEDYVLEHHPGFRRAIERAFAEAGRKRGVPIERLIEETKREMGR